MEMVCIWNHICGRSLTPSHVNHLMPSFNNPHSMKLHAETLRSLANPHFFPQSTSIPLTPWQGWPNTCSCLPDIKENIPQLMYRSWLVGQFSKVYAHLLSLTHYAYSAVLFPLTSLPSELNICGHSPSDAYNHLVSLLSGWLQMTHILYPVVFF